MNRLFDDVFRGFDAALPSLGGFASNGGRWSSVEISDSGKEIHVMADVPGMEGKDIAVLLHDGVLPLKGAKRNLAPRDNRRCLVGVAGKRESGPSCELCSDPDENAGLAATWPGATLVSRVCG